MHPILSKSTYLYGLQCIKRLYLYKKHYHLANPIDETNQAVFQTGTDVGELAQSLFPIGVNAQGDEPYHSEKTAKQTAALLANHDVIYEAAFIYNDVICAVDILVRKNNTYYAFEVKSTTKVKPQHIEDAALQYYVLSNAGIDLADFSIVVLNNEYVRQGNLNLDALFNPISVLKFLDDKQAFIAENISRLKKVVWLKSIPEVEMGGHCNSPYECSFTQYCLSQSPQELVEEIELNNAINVNKERWLEFSDELEYPLHFFDFESISYAVPEFDNSRPYQQIAFQYSLHIQKKPKSNPIHKAFLCDGVTDPRPALIKQMIKDLGQKGSIVVWNISFEKTVISKLAIDFPAFANELLALNERMIDLMNPFRPNRKIVTSEALQGSFSLKAVLPILAPELSYANLNIQEGGTASFKYGQLKEMNESEQTQVRQDLLDYCHLDTLAMLKVWEKINELV
jgi:hypothetical protein